MTQTEYLNKLLIDFEVWREKQGLTQKEIAEQLGITRSHLNKVLNGKTQPSLQLIQKLEETCYGK